MKSYFKEKYDSETYSTDSSFIIYNLYDDLSCYIRHIYIGKEERKAFGAKLLEAKFIKKVGCTSLYCDIDKTSNGWERILQYFVIHGDYNIIEEQENKIVLGKEL